MGKIRASRRFRRLVKTVVCACLFLLPVLFLLFALLLLFFIRSHDYAFLIGWYSLHWPRAFDADTISASCFTPAWYGMVKGWSPVVAAVLLVALVLYLFSGGRIWQWCGRCCSETGLAMGVMAEVYRRLSGREKGVLLGLFGLVLGYRIYFFLSFPLHPDELASYLFFARPGPVIATTSYPLPNNHVLFSLICSVLAQLPGLSPKMVMRLPSIFCDLLVLYGLFCLFFRWDGFRRGILAVAGVAFCYYTSYYAVQGRGYELQVGCALAGLLAGLECFVRPRVGGRKGFELFVVSAVAGSYINPGFIYSFLALALFVSFWLFVRRDRHGLFLLLRGGILIVGLVLLLYTPLVLASGWHSLAANEAVTGFGSYREVAEHFSSFTFILKDGSYYGRAGMYLILAFLAASCFFFRWGWIGGRFYVYSAAYLAAVLGAMVLLILFSKMYPFERALCFWILGANILFVNIVYDVLRSRVAAERVLPVLAIFLFVKVGGSLRGLYWERWSIGQRKEVIAYYTIRRDLERLAALHPASWQVMHSDDWYPMYLREYLIGREGGDGGVFYDRGALRGQVVLLPDDYRAEYTLRGYELWGGGRMTVVGERDKTMGIYLRE